MALDEIKKIDIKFLKIETYEVPSGYEALFAVISNPLDLKFKAMEIEQSSFLGRFMDIDILDNSYTIITREDIKAPQRRCFLCQNSAKICARSRKHSIYELLNFIHNQVKKHEKNCRYSI